MTTEQTDDQPALAESIPEAPDYEFNFSTAAIPPIVFAIDDQAYEMRTIDHLTPKDEAEIRVMFRQDSQISTSMSEAVRHKQMGLARKLSDQQTELRIRVIEMMTTVPKEVAEMLHVPDELRLITKIFQGIEQEPDEDFIGKRTDWQAIPDSSFRDRPKD